MRIVLITLFIMLTLVGMLVNLLNTFIKKTINIDESKKYQAGSYCDIKGAEGLDAHHIGQKALMNKFVKNYGPKTAPAINVPKVGHTVL